MVQLKTSLELSHLDMGVVKKNRNAFLQKYRVSKDAMMTD